MISGRNHVRLLASTALVLGMLWLAATMGLAGDSRSPRILSVTSSPPREPGKESSDRVQEGFVVTGDGVHIFYQVVGDGPETIVIPGRLFLIHTLQRLAPGHRLIFYDTRSRGKSDAVRDPKRKTIMDDVRDMEAVRKHLDAEKITPIGYSYMGMLVILYARDYPQNVARIVQLDPVPIKYDTKYPPGLSEDYTAALDPIAVKKLDQLQKQGFDRNHPREYCEMDWDVQRFALVGDRAHVNRLGVPTTGLCDFENEWPVNLNAQFAASFASIQTIDLTNADLAKISMPVLTIHGTKDKNAPYGGGREWAMKLPNARLLTVQGGAHQSFDEYPEIVIPAIDQFLKGSWPTSAEKVTMLVPGSQ